MAVSFFMKSRTQGVQKGANIHEERPNSGKKDWLKFGGRTGRGKKRGKRTSRAAEAQTVRLSAGKGGMLREQQCENAGTGRLE